jgi:YegS/Rv2252/BmrU family lipid kinase
MIIYNPRSGQGLKLPNLFQHFLGLRSFDWKQNPEDEHVLGQIVDGLKQYGIHASAACTSMPGDGTRLARECVETGYDLVVAVGGDGTINEVVNGLAGSEVVLGVIPAGTVNVYGLLMKLPGDLEGACRVIAGGTVRRVDLGRVENRYFLCMAGVGFDAFVIQQVDSGLKKAWGAIAYALVAGANYFFYPFRQIVVQVDQQTTLKKGYFLIVGNGKYYGGDMIFSSRADMCDGLLDVCLMKRKNIWDFFGYVLALRRGNLEKYIHVEVFQCRSLFVSSRGRHPVHVDAEYIGRTPAAIQVVPSALKVVVPS